MSKKDNHHSAETWAIKLDQGLTQEEALEFETLKKENPEFMEAVLQSQRSWDVFKDLLPDVSEDLLKVETKQPTFAFSIRWMFAVSTLALGCLAAVIWLGGWPFASSSQSIVEVAQSPRTIRFDDGSIARLNSGSKIHYSYTDSVRLVNLMHGEAHFEVAKNEEVPFVVYTDNVRIRAVGTAFNVKVGQSEVNVLVTEGKVEIKAEKSENPGISEIEYLVDGNFDSGDSLGYFSEGEKAKIYRNEQEKSSPVSISREIAETQEELQWQEPLLTFLGPTLRDLVDEFQLKSGMTLIVNDPKIYNVRIVGGAFASSDPFGILNLLKESYGISWSQIDSHTVVMGNSDSDE